MERKRNWAAAGFGLSLFAGVAVAIDPLIAAPIGVAGIGLFLYGLFPNLFSGSKPSEICVEKEAVRVEDALQWIIDNTTWESRLGAGGLLLPAALVFRQAARDGEITVRGRRELERHNPPGDFDPTWEDIETAYWRTHELDLPALLCEESHLAVTETKAISAGDLNTNMMPRYGMLRVWRSELESKWPPIAEVARPTLISDEGPVFWSICEVITYLSHGVAKTSRQLATETRAILASGGPVVAKEEDAAFDAAEQRLFERLRAGELLALGKREKSETYEEIPAKHFLSSVAVQLLHDTIDVDWDNLEARANWDGPKYRDVRLKRSDVLNAFG